MILVFLVVCILFLGLGIWLLHDGWDHDLSGAFFTAIGGIGLFVSFIVLITLCISVINLKTVDERIAMYQEENAKIECQIAEAVEKYQEYETGIFTEVAPKSATTLVALYPELKSDTLVNSQIEVYMANNQKIKELREEKIGGRVNRWWLYFGG